MKETWLRPDACEIQPTAGMEGFNTLIGLDPTMDSS